MMPQLRALSTSKSIVKGATFIATSEVSTVNQRADSKTQLDMQRMMFKSKGKSYKVATSNLHIKFDTLMDLITHQVACLAHSLVSGWVISLCLGTETVHASVKPLFCYLNFHGGFHTSTQLCKVHLPPKGPDQQHTASECAAVIMFKHEEEGLEYHQD